MLPIVAIIGRPNVGKSTLFNRLAGKQLAIVHDSPGVTRDRHYADTHIHGRDVTVIDTGGFDPTTDDPMGQGIAKNVRAAIDEADVIVCVLDGTGPAHPTDADAVRLLRHSAKPVVYVANKVDGPRQEDGALELYALGVDKVIPLSSLHGRGTAELGAAITSALPPAVATVAPDDGRATRVALIGRPNAGKSSIFNRLTGSDRSLVDHRPGTTRDPVDSEFEVEGQTFVLVDTAGVRRRSKVSEEVESASVMRAIRSIGRAEIVVLMCDADAGLAEQDQRLLGLAVDRRRAIVVGLNKVDLLAPKDRKKSMEDTQRALHFAPWAPVVPMSAKTGEGVGKLTKAIRKAASEYSRRVSTSELNRFFESVLERQPPPTKSGKAPRLYYVTQAQTAPPAFVAMTSAPDAIAPAYRRFVVNQIRKRFGFESVPVTVYFRARRRGRKS